MVSETGEQWSPKTAPERTAASVASMIASTTSGAMSVPAVMPMAIGTAIGVNLEAPLFDVFEDGDGIIDPEDDLLQTTVTGGDGTYLFEAVGPGDTIVKVDETDVNQTLTVDLTTTTTGQSTTTGSGWKSSSHGAASRKKAEKVRMTSSSALAVPSGRKKPITDSLSMGW